MKTDLSLDTEKLAALLRRLSGEKPTRQTLDAALREYAPLLSKIIRAGWTDQSLVKAFEDENGDAGADLSAFRKLLHEARDRERSSRKSPKQRSGKTPVPATGKHSSPKPQAKTTTPKPSDVPFNDGV